MFYFPWHKSRSWCYLFKLFHTIHKKGAWYWTIYTVTHVHFLMMDLWLSALQKRQSLTQKTAWRRTKLQQLFLTWSLQTTFWTKSVWVSPVSYFTFRLWSNIDHIWGMSYILKFLCVLCLCFCISCWCIVLTYGTLLESDLTYAPLRPDQMDNGALDMSLDEDTSSMDEIPQKGPLKPQKQNKGNTERNYLLV